MKLLRLGLIFCFASLGALLRAQSVPEQNTVIESESFDLRSTDTETTSVFTGRVVLTGTNLRLTCDRLEIVALRSGDPKATIGKIDDKIGGRLKEIITAFKQKMGYGGKA